MALFKRNNLEGNWTTFLSDTFKVGQSDFLHGRMTVTARSTCGEPRKSSVFNLPRSKAG